MASVPERSAEDRASGILRVTLGSQPKRLPTLPLRASAEWVESLGARLAEFTDRLSVDQSAEGLTGFATFAAEAILEAIVAYDRTGALGGRDWLEANADPEQLYVAFRQIALVVFPFVADLQGLLALLPGLLKAGESMSASSTSGPSPTGASTQGRSKSGSTRRS